MYVIILCMLGGKVFFRGSNFKFFLEIKKSSKRTVFT